MNIVKILGYYKFEATKFKKIQGKGMRELRKYMNPWINQSSRSLIHLLIGMLLNNDFILKLARDLFSMIVLFILLSQLMFLMCEFQIVPMREDNILA